METADAQEAAVAQRRPAMPSVAAEAQEDVAFALVAAARPAVE